MPRNQFSSPVRTLLLFVALAPLIGCTSWSGRATTSPIRGGIYGHAMAYDAAQNHVLCFDGETAGPGSEVNETWEWDGAAWNQASPTNAPSSRFKPALACDTSRNRVVLFGGVAGSNQSQETWEWDGSNWTIKHPPVSPPARHYHAMAYDAGRNVVVWYGGYSSAAPRVDLADTWEWNGSFWAQRHPIHSPPAIDGHAMAYDANRGRIVLFGGVHDVVSPTQPFKEFNDVWEWNGLDWTQVPNSPASTLPVPAPRGRMTLAYDATNKVVVMFGGYSSTANTYYNDTYTWDGTIWRPQAASGSGGRFDHGMAYDLNRSVMVLFGGINASITPSVCNDTWER